MKRREEDNIYESANEAIYRVSSKAHEYCITSSAHMPVSGLRLTLSKLNYSISS
jgi:hypothetical protein